VSGDGSIELAQTMPGQSGAGPLAPGSSAGEYQIVRALGSGAMGDVYEGKHPIIGKRVAIKVIKQVLAASEEAAQRFIREAKAVNQVEHPNVVDVFAFGRLDDGRLYLVMDLLEGQSLDAYLREHGPLSASEMAEVMEPVCAAVAAAHRAGVIHRDLKPANVFLARAGDGPFKVYVLDFGVAKLMSSAQEKTGQTLTGQGVWVGTPTYMAPEQWTSEGASARSDIYALGAMTYELLTGASPFGADSIPGVMEKHFHAEIPRVGDTGRSIARHIDDALRRAMAKAPEDRFASADELWAALSGTGATAGARTTPSRTWQPAALGGAVVLAGALALVAMSDDEPVPSGAASSTHLDAGAELGKAKILSLPSGATVLREGRRIGETPASVSGQPGEELSLVVSLPGYLDQPTLARIGEDTTVELSPIRGFEGVWVIPGGELRRFERARRDGIDQVAAYRVSSSDDPGRFYRMFRFVPGAPGHVTFEASHEYVHESLANEPSCRTPLAARYELELATSTMTTRVERVDVSVVARRCVFGARRWSDPEPVTRVDAADVHVAESRAGAGPLAPSPVTSDLSNSAQLKGARPPINPNGTAETQAARQTGKEAAAKKRQVRNEPAPNRELDQPPMQANEPPANKVQAPPAQQQRVEPQQAVEPPAQQLKE